MIFANYHTHTTFCDGRDTPEQLVQESIRLGCPALGFSGHSYAFYDAACMPKENIRPYQAEIRRLQSTYSGQIRILLGIEQEYYSDEPTDAYDYVIGAVHNLRHGSEYRSVDHTRERLIAIVDDWFGGDASGAHHAALAGSLCKNHRHHPVRRSGGQRNNADLRLRGLYAHQPCDGRAR